MNATKLGELKKRRHLRIVFPDPSDPLTAPVHIDLMGRSFILETEDGRISPAVVANNMEFDEDGMVIFPEVSIIYDIASEEMLYSPRMFAKEHFGEISQEWLMKMPTWGKDLTLPRYMTTLGVEQ